VRRHLTKAAAKISTQSEHFLLASFSVSHNISLRANLFRAVYSVQCINFCEQQLFLLSFVLSRRALSFAISPAAHTHTYVPQPAQQWMMYGAILYALEKLFSRFVPAESTLCSLT
jgi:hypothetical protein